MILTKTRIIGCGDIGRRVARELTHHGADPAQIHAISQSEASVAQNRALGLKSCALNLDCDELESLSELPARQLYYFAPPPRNGVSDPRIARVLAATRTPPEKIVLISTTGVYGDCGGAWIDESAPTPAPTDRARRRLNAETQLRNWSNAHEVVWVILRVPGIYAPNRLPIARLKAQTALVDRAEAPWSNRIHADDLARIAVMAMHSEVSNEIINVCDDAPSSMTDYFLAIAEYTGLPAPEERPLAELLPTLSAGMRSYLRESRRISNYRMKARFGDGCLRYPELKAGLAVGDGSA